ncbi:MAG: hypothetical protein DDT36_01500 [Firmicutes bacterium]|nr:hypothetical protein [Bacillota bacterium]
MLDKPELPFYLWRDIFVLVDADYTQELKDIARISYSYERLGRGNVVAYHHASAAWY